MGVDKDGNYQALPEHRRYSSRDSGDRIKGRSDVNRKKSVPGQVSDPNNQIEEIERAIRRGQQKSIERIKNPYSATKMTKDTLSTIGYGTAVPAIGQPYYRPSLRNSYNRKVKQTILNPGFLALPPTLVGMGLLIAAIVLIRWTVTTTMFENNTQFIFLGLFRECNSSVTASGTVVEQCRTVEEIIATDYDLNGILQQTTRGLVIISAALSLIAAVLCAVLGINRCSKQKGSLISGALLGLAGACGVAGMGCFTAFLVDRINSAFPASVVLPGTSFYLGWAGAGCLVIACVISLLAHCANRK